MIKAITYEEMVKTVAAFLDSHSGINPNRIINRDGIRGATLAEMISPTQAYSPAANQTLMLFEFVEDQNAENFATVEKDPANMCVIQSYSLHLMLYGNKSPQDAQRVFASFKQGDNAFELRDKGVYVKGVDPIEPVNEFINDTLCLRRDIIVRLQARFVFEEAGDDLGEFDENQGVTVVVQNASNL